MNYILPYNNQWVVFDDRRLIELDRAGGESRDQAYQLRQLWDDYNKNKLSFFLAHGGGTDFINDYEADLVLLFAGNRLGKSFAGAAWQSIRVVPTDPDWDCFKKHGLIWQPFGGPVRAAACSYTIKTHLKKNIAPMLLEILPDHELKEYSPRYKGKGKKKINWRDDASIELACGTTIDFLAYEQDQATFESIAYKNVWMDEQCPEDKFNGLVERGRTGMEKTQFCGTMTPHRVEGRPDTGAGSWVHRLVKGNEDIGMSHSTYHISIDDVPECIYPAHEKAKAKQKWVTDPERRGDKKKIREGRARYFGEWQSSEGLVIEDWDEDIHWIDPIELPDDWTRVRGIDHGMVNPCAAVWIAVSPMGHAFLYREYFEAGRSVAQNALGIVEASGNKRIDTGVEEDEASGATYRIFEECHTNERYENSVLDSRSFGTKSDRGCDLGTLYNEMGLECTPASGQRDDVLLPIMREWFFVDYEKNHFVTGEPGAPRLYVFNTCHNFKREIEGWAFKAGGKGIVNSEKAAEKNDHLMDATKYALATDPEYMGDDYMDGFSGGGDHEPNSFTGY